MKGMTSRERVSAALEHREPDRVPVALGGGPYGLVDDVYVRLVAHLGLGDPVAPFRSGHNVSYMDDRVLERLGIDTRYVWPANSPSAPTTVDGNPDLLVDGYGQPWRRALPYFYPAQGILEAATIDEIDERVTWPQVSDPRWTRGAGERARALREDTDCFVIARMVTSHGPYQTASDLRGAEQFLMDMAADERFAMALTERVTDTIVGLMRGYLDEVGRYVDMVELPGDDYATQTGMAMSPSMFRTYFKPAIRRMVEVIKTYRADLKVMLHCDGALAPILPDLVEVGIDVVHPLEPLPAMNLDHIKATFGDRLAFLGAIDIRHALPGSREDVVDEVKRRIGQLAPGGGYVLAPANHIQPDVPPENVVTLFEAARTHGVYPVLAAAAGDAQAGRASA